MNFIFEFVKEYYWFGFLFCFVVSFWYQVKLLEPMDVSGDTPIILSEHDDEFELSLVIFPSLVWFLAAPIYTILLIRIYMR